MEFKHTLEVLYNQADEIKKLVAKLKGANEIRAIELDLLLEKLRNIYDLIIDLETSLPAIKKKESQSSGTKETIPAKQIQQEFTEEISDQEPVVEMTWEEEDITTKQKNEPVKSKEDNLTKGAQKPPQGFVSDRFKGSKHTLHEEMSGRKKQDDISTQYKSKPINNILGAIAVNERFELINHLFDGDKARFESTIEVLNRTGSFVEAYNYLQENFKWDMNDEYVQRILELIRRKLIVRKNE